MKTIRSLTMLIVCCSGAVSFSEPLPPADYPLSCKDTARPLVFQGWDELANARVDEARDTLKRAIVADPNCVMARASLGAITPGSEGRKLFDSALEDLAGLREVERLDLKALEASRKGDSRNAFALAEKTVELAPNVVIANLNLAHYAIALQKWDEAEAAANKATELSPMTGAGWNLLGYAQLRAHRTAEAIKAFRKYVQVAPNEPNAHDSLGDALLADNQLDAAATEYQRAIDGSAGKFWSAWSGLATVKALEGEWMGVRAALAGQKAAAIQPVDKMKADLMTAWSWAAQGRLSDALKVIDAAQKEAATARVEAAAAQSNVVRGQLNLVSGKYEDAIKAFSAADSARLSELSLGQQRNLRGVTLSGLSAAQARAGKLPDAARTLARLDEFAKASLSGTFATDTTSYARGVLALMQNDARGAIEALQKCSEPFDLCHFTLADAQEEAGETAAAARTRESLVKSNHRDAEYWFVWARIEAKLRESSM